MTTVTMTTATRQLDHRPSLPMEQSPAERGYNAMSFISPSGMNSANTPLMDRSPRHDAAAFPKPPPPPLTKRLLSILSPDDTNNKTVRASLANDSKQLETISSPADSVMQAMKNELEELIDHIDSLTFQNKRSHSRTTPSNKFIFQDEASTAMSDMLSRSRRPQEIFRDRTNNNSNRDASPQVKFMTRQNNDSNDGNESSLNHSPPRLEPAGNPPAGESSIYFHDESLSMILSKSSIGEEFALSVQEREDTKSIAGARMGENPKSTLSPSIISAFREHGILPEKGNGVEGQPPRTKAISFRQVSKDPTPTKYTPRMAMHDATPIMTRSRLMESNGGKESNASWEVTPSTDHSRNIDRTPGKRSSLQNRKATPYPSRSYRDLTLLPDATFHDGSTIVHDLNALTNAASEPPESHKEVRALPVLSSPENAKKLLETAVNALQDARQEREIARQWAQDIKESVKRWVDEQRELIRTESASVAVTSAASCAQVEQLERSISKLEMEIGKTNSRRTENEQKLENLLRSQELRIRSLVMEFRDMKDQLTHKSDVGIVGALKKERKQFPSLQLRGTAKPKKSLIPRKANCDGPLSESSWTSSQTSRSRRKSADGGHVIDYGNGVSKEVHPDGTTVTRFVNGDVETRFNDFTSPDEKGRRGIVAYFHSKEGVLQITQWDGSILYEYTNGQMERHYKDGTKIVLFPDGTKEILRAGHHFF